MKTITSQLIRLALIVVLAALCSAPTLLAAQASRSAVTAVNDAWITTQIYAKYFADPDIKGRNINVDTDKGVVTLSGTVYSEDERRQAVSKAREIDGVSTVMDTLVLRPGKPPVTAKARDRALAEWPKVKADSSHAIDRVEKDISDAWITTKVQSKFYLDPNVKGAKIDVTTRNGIVTLTGTVSGAAEETQAISLTKNTDGVKEIVDKLAAK